MRFKLIVLVVPVYFLGVCGLESKYPEPTVVQVIVTTPVSVVDADRKVPSR